MCSLLNIDNVGELDFAPTDRLLRLGDGNHIEIPDHFFSQAELIGQVNISKVWT
jgi:hypothetical protein